MTSIYAMGRCTLRPGGEQNWATGKAHKIGIVSGVVGTFRFFLVRITLYAP